MSSRLCRLRMARESLSVSTTSHIYVEPGEPPRLLLGSFCVQGESGLVVFDLSPMHKLSFAVRDNDILLLNVKLASPDGKPLLDVVDGYVRKRADDVELRSRSGKVEVPGGLQSPYVPRWLRPLLTREDPFYATLRLPLLSLEVMDRGLVRVHGLWLTGDRGIVVTRDRLWWVAEGMPRPLSLSGAGESTVMHYVGPLGGALFGP